MPDDGSGLPQLHADDDEAFTDIELTGTEGEIEGANQGKPKGMRKMKKEEKKKLMVGRAEREQETKK